MPVTSLYAALLAIFYIALTLNVVRKRIKYRVGIHSGGQRELDLAIRVHGNFAEYIPIALILMALLEAGRANIAWIHITGQVLLAGRLLHAWGLGRSAGASKPRFLGGLITFSVILGQAFWLLALLWGG